MKIDLIPWQSSVYKDNHRFRIVCAGRRAGKSVLSRLIILDWAIKRPALYWIVNPTYKQGREIHWRTPEGGGIANEIPKGWIRRTNEARLEIELNNGSVIQLKGADDPDSLRGVQLGGLVIDEIAAIRNWSWLWSEVLRATLADQEAPAMFISTPKGYNHFYELYEMGQKEDKLYKSWRFTSYENTKPQIRREADNAKRELTEDTFQQEYMADFRKYTGLVYKDFDREVNVIKPFDIPEDWQIYRGYDYGFSPNPTAWLWIAVDNDDNWFIIDENYGSDKTSVDWSGILHSNSFDKRVVQSFGDPSAAGAIAEYQNHRVYITPATREQKESGQNWVQFGIEKVAEKLKVLPGRTVSPLWNKGDKTDRDPLLHKGGYPALFIFKNCVETIREFETYRWKEKSVTQAQDLNEPDQPEKANDHAMDALRYFAVSYKKIESKGMPADQDRFDKWGWNSKDKSTERNFRIGT